MNDLNNIKVKNTKISKETKIVKHMERLNISNFYCIGVGLKSEYINIPKKYSKKLNLYGAEPIKEIINLIEHNFAGELKNIAISPNIGKKIFYINADDIETSSFEVAYESLIKGNNIISREVEAISLDQFDESYNNPDNILLWMDIEGYELQALTSGIKLLNSKRVKLINLEVRNNKLSENSCNFNEIHEFLTNQNFDFIQAYNFCFDEFGKTHHWDVIYELRN